MAAPTTPGLTPSEVAFLAEHELVDVIPRQRLDGLQLLGGTTPPLIPPRRVAVPLWLALLLKRQQRANISAPAWLTVDRLSRILELETQLGAERGFTRSTLHPPAAAHSVAVSPPFIPSSSTSDSNSANGANGRPFPSPFDPTTQRSMSSTVDGDEDGDSAIGTGAPGFALPYHWLEIAHLLLGSPGAAASSAGGDGSGGGDGAGSGAADDIPDADAVRRLIRDLREARAAKIRQGILPALDGGRAAKASGIGAMELAEHRLFVTGVVDGLRKVGASKEAARREREEEEDRERGGPGADDSDDDMGL